MHTTGTPSSRRPRQIAGDMRPVSITARSIGPYRSSIMAIASGELSTFSDTTFRPLSSTMQPCVDSIDRSNQIGRAHVCTPVTNAHLVCRLLLDKKKNEKTHELHP